MKVAVLTLTRDRLSYTQHCFASLAENAGCEYDHFVLDQGSTDGTTEWLIEQEFAAGIFLGENIGISRGMNRLLDASAEVDDYDVVCTFDNDCEVTMPGTLAACAEVARHGEWVVSPRVEGLKFPPPYGEPVEYRGQRIGPYQEMGGIFRVMPGEFARSFRFKESNPLWGHDERDVGRACRDRGLGSGYLVDWSVNHYRTTVGQEQELPGYFRRKLAEMR